MSIDVLVINLTRFGDLLQSQAVIDDLHEAGHSVGLVCLENFAAAVPLLRNVEQSWPLPGARLLSLLDSNWPAALQEVNALAYRIASEGNPKFVINLTPSLPARLLTRILATGGAQTLGFDLDKFGFGVNHGVWASFFSAAASRRGNSPFNLSDLLRKMAFPLTKGKKGSFHLAPPPDSAWADAFLAKETASLGQKPAGFVAFQLGASQDSRRWPVHSFAALGEIIWQQTGNVPLLLGAASEKHLGEEYAKYATHPHANAIGRTDIPQLASLVHKSRLLVTNDTGTMHLAAGLRTPILAFFLATAQPWDTGPLLPGSVSLEPKLDCHPCGFSHVCARKHLCRQQISVQTAASQALALLGAPAHPAVTSDSRIWQTEIDPDGLIVLKPKDNSDNSGPGEWLAWQRVFWSRLLDCLDSRGERTSHRDYKNLPAFSGRARVVPVLEQAAATLASIAECGALAEKSPKMGTLFLRNCERLQSLLDAEPSLSALTTFWREFRLNQAGEIADFACQSRLLEHNVRELAAALAAA